MTSLNEGKQAENLDSDRLESISCVMLAYAEKDNLRMLLPKIKSILIMSLMLM